MQYDAAIANGTISGRWPSNFAMTHSATCERVGTKRVTTGAITKPHERSNQGGYSGPMPQTASVIHHADADGLETVDDWHCADWCPVRAMDEQSGDRPGQHAEARAHRPDGYGGGLLGRDVNAPYADTGGASRFFTVLPFEPEYDVPFVYVAKPSTREREKGVEHLRSGNKRGNTHATVKSVALMRKWCVLVAPRGGVVLDCFAGSGTTGVAALADDFRVVLIEKEANYVEIIRNRIIGDNPLFNRQEPVK